MKHSISVKLPKPIAIRNSDVSVVIQKNGVRFGTITISKGSIDWRPKNAKLGRKMLWSEFAKIIEKSDSK
jgi:hypothetical protein